MANNASAKDAVTRLTPGVIADAERILSGGNRVELMPDKGIGVRVFEIMRRERRRLTTNGGRDIIGANRTNRECGGVGGAGRVSGTR